MTTTIAQVRAALSAAVDGIANLRCVPYITDGVAPNQATIIRGEIDYNLVMAGRPATHSYTVTVYAPEPADRTSQMFLDTLAEPTGTGSMKAAIEYGDATLGALVDYVSVTKVSGVGFVTVGAIEYIAETFTVDVCISPA